MNTQHTIPPEGIYTHSTTQRDTLFKEETKTVTEIAIQLKEATDSVEQGGVDGMEQETNPVETGKVSSVGGYDVDLLYNYFWNDFQFHGLCAELSKRSYLHWDTSSHDQVHHDKASGNLSHEEVMNALSVKADSVGDSGIPGEGSEERAAAGDQGKTRVVSFEEDPFVWDNTYRCTKIFATENQVTQYQCLVYRVSLICVDITMDDATCKDVIVFAHRGTCSVANVFTDLNFAVGRDIDIVSDARDFIQNMRCLLEDSNVYVQTGHSLGGLVAEICGDYFGDRVVSFDSPGSKKILRNTEFAEKHFYCYFGKQNLVNTYTDHVGTLRKLSIPVQDISYDYSITWIRRILDIGFIISWFSNYFTSNESKNKLLASWLVGLSTTILEQTLQRHKISLICSHMKEYVDVSETWFKNSMEYLKWEIQKDTFYYKFENTQDIEKTVHTMFKHIFKSEKADILD
eukprot:TRINITY_DN142_c0_g1_i1.p1 TRINITY_DN142_c0_g1~~TRINITY_DN142_c0_g1_i1.p1  ORF type:complete len:469 (-),score=93.57 TRINITY_DN142_c0_g1_i1:82-1455(-)